MSDKQHQWQECKKNAPDVADFLTQLAKTMGKPNAVSVEINGEAILKSGEFDKPKILSVPKYSQIKWRN